jgi:DNA-directed RNA polymerase specialized sigma24 family protein
MLKLRSKTAVPSGRPKWTDAGLEVDRELARKIGEGDREALARWLDRHLGAVYGYLARRLGPGHEEIAATLARATFSTALQRLKPYARGTTSIPMRLWLLKLAGERLDREHITRNKEEPARNADDATTHAPPSAQALREVLGLLPTRQQAAISLALFEGMAPEEIAAASGRGVPRAMRDLRAALKRTGRLLEAQSKERS